MARRQAMAPLLPSKAARLAAALLVVVSAASAASAAAAAPVPLPGALAAAAAVAGTPEQVAFLGTKAHAGAYRLVNSSGSEGAGVDTIVGGLPAYLALPPKTKAGGGPKAAVIAYSDIYGFRANGTRKIADRLAAQGYVAVVPDFFSGRSAGTKGGNATEERAFIVALTRAEVGRGAAGVLSALRKDFPSIQKVGAYGYCWGGRHATIAAGGLAEKGAAADAAVAFHAALIAPEEFEAVSRPLLFVNAAVDRLFNGSVVAAVQEVSARAAKRSPPVAVEIKGYPGTTHGFAARAAPNDTVATAAAEAAFQDGLAFLKRQGVTP